MILNINKRDFILQKKYMKNFNINNRDSLFIFFFLKY